MIRINLLPESYRKAERTSPKVFAVAMLGVICVCSSLGWFGMVYFGELEKVQAKHANVTDTLDGVTKQEQLYDSLVQERKDFSRRADTIRDIAKGRRLWTKFSDELIDVITNDGEIDRHVAWFSSIQVRGSRDGRKGPTITLPGFVQGGDMRKIANLHDDVETTEFFRDIAEYSPIAGAKKIDAELYPPESFVFSWKWKFKESDKWIQNTVARAKPGKPAKPAKPGK